MTRRVLFSRTHIGLVFGVGALVLIAACSSDDAGALAPPGNSDQTTGGSSNTGGSAVTSAGTSSTIESGGSSSAGAPSGNAGSSAESGAAGDASGGAPATGGTGGTGGESTAGTGGTGQPAALCIYHTDAPTELGGAGGVGGAAGEAGASAAGAAGAPGPTHDVSVKVNAVIGEHLIAKAGGTLYIYASDVPGDCNNAPVTNCTKDCLKSWPVFDAGLRALDPKLSDAGFGRILRTDGVYQTTFNGWPLYNYIDKTGAQDVGIAGQSKSWNVAKTVTPTVVIMKQPGKEGIRYLADYRGRTLYTYDKDTLGGTDAYPVSACTESCSANHPALMDRTFSTVPSLEPSDFGVFVRDAGALQISYKGAPLYFSLSDDKPGIINGAADGFAVVKIP